MGSTLDLSAPALPAPNGVTPNFDNPPNGNGVAAAALIPMMVIPTVVVLLRAYTKAYVSRKILTEDVLIFLAYVNYWGCYYGSWNVLDYPGYFVHLWDLRLRDTIHPAYYIFVFGVFYSVVLALLKVAILVEWCRIFVPPGSRTTGFFWWGSLGIIVLQAGFGIAAIFLLNFRCIPHEATWDWTIAGKKCIPLHPLQLLSCCIHLFSDVAIFLLPQKIIWSLNMSTQKKVAVALIFSLGTLAIVSSVVKLIATVNLDESSDTFFFISPVMLWSTGEMACGFFVACMPTLPKALHKSPFGHLVRKAALGLRISNAATECTRVKRGHSKGVGSTGNKTSQGTASSSLKVYLQIDEGVITLGKLGAVPSESTEHLRIPYNPARLSALTTKTQDTHTGSDISDGGPGADRHHEEPPSPL